MSCLQAAESVLIHSVRGQPGNPVVDADSLRGPKEEQLTQTGMRRDRGRKQKDDMDMERTKDK